MQAVTSLLFFLLCRFNDFLKKEIVEMPQKIHLFLAGDSTVQSYPESDAPRAGWGQELISFFEPDAAQRSEYCSDPDFPTARAYESERICIDNRAMGGRSCRTFEAEGRFASLLKDIHPHDYVLFQFGHNDANIAKPERYLSPNDFHDTLKRLTGQVLSKDALPVLVTPIAMLQFKEASASDARQEPISKSGSSGICEISFPAYRSAMLQLSREEKIPLIDLGRKSAERCTELGPAACRQLFLHVPAGQYPAFPDGASDNAHLQKKGASEFAKIVASDLARLL